MCFCLYIYKIDTLLSVPWSRRTPYPCTGPAFTPRGSNGSCATRCSRKYHVSTAARSPWFLLCSQELWEVCPAASPLPSLFFPHRYDLSGPVSPIVPLGLCQREVAALGVLLLPECVRKTLYVGFYFLVYFSKAVAFQEEPVRHRGSAAELPGRNSFPIAHVVRDESTSDHRGGRRARLVPGEVNSSACICLTETRCLPSRARRLYGVLWAYFLGSGVREAKSSYHRTALDRRAAFRAGS